MHDSVFRLQGDLCLKVEEHVLCVEMRVDAVLSNLEGTGMLVMSYRRSCELYYCR